MQIKTKYKYPERARYDYMVMNDIIWAEKHDACSIVCRQLRRMMKKKKYRVSFNMFKDWSRSAFYWAVHNDHPGITQYWRRYQKQHGLQKTVVARLTLYSDIYIFLIFTPEEGVFQYAPRGCLCASCQRSNDKDIAILCTDIPEKYITTTEQTIFIDTRQMPDYTEV